MAQEVKINIATVGAQQATQQTKTLKQQIKELRDELGQLTAGTEEYNQKVQELGNLMHQNQEITEQAKMATNDYGQTLANLSTVASGVVGSMSAISGVMNLVGASNSDAMKAVQTMTSFMGILQGLSAIDNARKAFKGLGDQIKTTKTETDKETVSTQMNTSAAGQNAAAMTGAAAATKAEGAAAVAASKGVDTLSFSFKKLGTALKSFMASNIFTIILLVVGAIYTVVSSIVSKNKELQEQLKKEAEEAKKIREEAALTNVGGPGLGNTNYEQMGEKERRNAAGSRVLVPESDEHNDAKKQLADYRDKLHNLEKEDKKYSKEYQTTYKNLYYDQKKMLNELYFYYAKQLGKYKDWESETDTQVREEKRKHYNEYKSYIENLRIQMGQNWYEWQNYQDEVEADRIAKHKARLDNQYQIDKINLKNQYEQQEITTEEYYTRLKAIETKYLNDYIKNAAAFKLTKKDIELLQANHNSTMIALNKDLARELNRIWSEENDPEKEHTARKLQEQTRAAEEAVRRRKQDETIEFGDDDFYERQFELANSWIVKRIALLDEYNNLEVEREYQKNQKLLELSIERQRMDLDELEYKKNMEINDDSDNTEFKIQEYQRQYEEQIISLDEFQRKEEELRLQHQQKVQEINNEYIQARADAEYQLSETIYQLHEQEYEHEVDMFQRKIQLTKNYLNAFSTLTSGVQGLLNEAQNGMKEGSKEYEQIQEAKIIMDTITGSLSAFMSGVESGIPAPYNFILAGVLAATATATGIMALQNLKSKKLSSSAASAPTVNPYETLSYETNSNIEGNIQDSRVYVLEQDITDTVNRVNVAETEASF